MDIRQYYFWLSRTGINRIKARALIEHFGGIEPLYNAACSGDNALYSHLDTADSKRFASSVRLRDAAVKEFQEILDSGIVMLCPECAQFPDCLKEDAVDPPLLLYLKGNLELLNTTKIAIVGTRDCSDYGGKNAKLFSSALASAGLTIVSGLADGVDSIAHRAALDVKGNTIAVLGNGFNRIYPAGNFQLFRTICEVGLAVSEYHPDMSAAKYTFPERNRLISGLSHGVLVVEGGEKSGSLITADFAIVQGRELFAIPGRIDMKCAEGVNRLIKSAQSSMVLQPDDILHELKIPTASNSSHKFDKIQLDVYEEIVYNILLKSGKLHFNEIFAQSKLDVVTLTSVLFNLEEKKIVTKLFGNNYSV